MVHSRFLLMVLNRWTLDLIIVGTGVCPNTGFLIRQLTWTNRQRYFGQSIEWKRVCLESMLRAMSLQGPTAFGDKHVVCALWPTAVEEGKVAGANMAGVETVYTR